MSTPQLTVIVPGIRPGGWRAVYDSIGQAYSGSFEMIVIGPPAYVLSADAEPVPWTFIEEWGCPTRAMQVGLFFARAEWVTWMADDGVFLPGSLDAAFATMQAAGPPVNKVAVTMRYQEGESDDQNAAGDNYYRMTHHEDLRGLGLPDDWLILSVWLLHRETVLKLGGMDCDFETFGVSFPDLAIRWQRAVGRVVLTPELCARFSHQPGETGDHGPVHHAHLDHDLPLFRKIYEAADGPARSVIGSDSVQRSAARWERRFGKAGI